MELWTSARAGRFLSTERAPSARSDTPLRDGSQDRAEALTSQTGRWRSSYEIRYRRPLRFAR